MNKYAKAWVAALRSGKYKQGRGALARKRRNQKHYRYCCLGVACEVLGVAAREGNGIVGDNLKYFGESGETANLSPAMAKKLGLSGTCGEFTDKNSTDTSLVGLNDEENYTFEQIADVIESEPPGLFRKARKK